MTKDKNDNSIITYLQNAISQWVITSEVHIQLYEYLSIYIRYNYVSFVKIVAVYYARTRMAFYIISMKEGVGNCLKKNVKYPIFVMVSIS